MFCHFLLKVGLCKPLKQTFKYFLDFDLDIKADRLQGRPERPVGTLGTAKIYRLLGRTILCYPILFR